MTPAETALRAAVTALREQDPSRSVSDASGEAADLLEAAGADRDDLSDARLRIAAEADKAAGLWDDADWGNRG